MFYLKVARCSFSGPVPPKFEHKLRRRKQSFGRNFVFTKFHIFVQNNSYAFLHISNALLVTAVHVKMKHGDNALNDERLSLVMKKLPIKK